MDQIKRYGHIGYLVNVSEKLLEMYPGMMTVYVKAEDFDRVTAERDALQQRLTAADERVDVLEGLFGEVLDAVGREPLDLDAVVRLRARMRAALKPA